MDGSNRSMPETRSICTANIFIKLLWTFRYSFLRRKDDNGRRVRKDACNKIAHVTRTPSRSQANLSACCKHAQTAWSSSCHHQHQTLNNPLIFIRPIIDLQQHDDPNSSTSDRLSLGTSNRPKLRLCIPSPPK